MLQQLLSLNYSSFAIVFFFNSQHFIDKILWNPLDIASTIYELTGFVLRLYQRNDRSHCLEIIQKIYFNFVMFLGFSTELVSTQKQVACDSKEIFFLTNCLTKIYRTWFLNFESKALSLTKVNLTTITAIHSYDTIFFELILFLFIKCTKRFNFIFFNDNNL